jgi:hypothetical protein
MPEAVKQFLDSLFDPIVFSLLVWGGLAAMLLFYRLWTKPAIAFTLFALAVLYLALSLPDPNFRKIITKPDNVPIAGMLFAVLFCSWLALRQAAINDERMARGLPPREKLESDDRVLVWPDLVYSEFLAALVCMVILIVWSLAVKAPLEEPANPARTPNPSKAPWYFLGLQDLLVYFDPWIAGVVLPGMIITGLILIPYCDPNPRGQGYYTLRERPFAVAVYMFGFIAMWVAPVIMGTFLRGPNWNFFGPYEVWDVHKVEPLTNVNLSEYFWVIWLKKPLPENKWVRELPGLIAIAGYFLFLPPLLMTTVFRKMYRQMGFIRYSLMIFHLLVMFGVLVKMVLRWTINLKYIVAIPENFFNI